MKAYEEFNEADFVKPEEMHRIALISQHRREHGHELPKVAKGISHTVMPHVPTITPTLNIHQQLTEIY